MSGRRPELGTAGPGRTYDGTIGDLVLSSTGDAIGATIIQWLDRRRTTSSQGRRTAPAPGQPG